MQTRLPDSLLATDRGRRADEILRSCVHCGMCNAVCPTYQLLGDELDGPRGRIYLIKELLEEVDSGAAKEGERIPSSAAARTAQTHLDRCLTCRGCEVACPSGVQYGELLEIGRDAVEARVKRVPWDAVARRWLGRVAPRPEVFVRWVRFGNWFRWLLPGPLGKLLPPRPQDPAGDPASAALPQPRSDRRALVLRGCVQRVATPATTIATERLLQANGMAAVWAEQEGCCGGLNLHLGQTETALDAIRRNIDALRPFLDEVEVIVSTASGCGVTIKDYGRLLAGDAEYAAAAARVAGMTRDLAEVAAPFTALGSPNGDDRRKVAWHAPCTLHHGQRLTGNVESLLSRAGFELVQVADAHICCGSAGTYSLLQSRLAGELRDEKLANLMAGAPDIIVTANVGCQTHLASVAPVPVVHWAELLAPP